MVTRIRRSRAESPDTSGTAIEVLMKSISKSRAIIEAEEKSINIATAELYALMKKAKKSEYVLGDITAMLVRSQGRETNVIDPLGFRRLVKNDKEFYSCVSISVTQAKKVLPEKQLATITTTTPAKLGEETVKVVTGPVKARRG